MIHCRPPWYSRMSPRMKGRSRVATRWWYPRIRVLDRREFRTESLRKSSRSVCAAILAGAKIRKSLATIEWNSEKGNGFLVIEFIGFSN